MRGAGAPLMRVHFTLHHDLQVKEPFLQKTTMMSMKVHVSSLLPPIYRNFYPCVEKIKFFKHFDVAPPVKLCAPAGLPARRRRHFLLFCAVWLSKQVSPNRRRRRIHFLCLYTSIFFFIPSRPNAKIKVDKSGFYCS